MVISSLRVTKEGTEEFDELGFRKANGVASCVDSEGDAAQVPRMVSFLEFSLGSAWPEYRGHLPPSAHLTQLLCEGVPFSLRAHLYALIGNIYVQMGEGATYLDIYGESVKHSTDKTIEKDLLRTLPDNFFFMYLEDEGILRLRRILNALRHHLPQ